MATYKQNVRYKFQQCETLLVGTDISISVRVWIVGLANWQSYFKQSSTSS